MICFFRDVNCGGDFLDTTAADSNKSRGDGKGFSFRVRPYGSGETPIVHTYSGASSSDTQTSVLTSVVLAQSSRPAGFNQRLILGC